MNNRLLMLVLTILSMNSSSFGQPPEIETNTCSFKCQKCEKEILLECKNLNSTNFLPLSEQENSYDTIRFSGNYLNRLIKPIFKLNNEYLRHLDLSGNQISAIASAHIFSNMPNLKLLDLSRNRLSFKSIEEMKAFESIASSLEILKLNNAFGYGKKATSFLDSISIDRQIHGILEKSNLKNLKALELDSNSLTLFNLKSHNHALQSNKNENEIYVDLLCLVPELERLSLKSNLIEEIYFDESCLNDAKLGVVELQSNKINTLELSMIRVLKKIKSKNEDFRVHLENNPFKCDCTLFDFYTFLLEENDSDIIADYDKLLCTHDDSFHSTLGKKLIDSKLSHYCSSSPLLDKYDILTSQDNEHEDEHDRLEIFTTSTVRTTRFRNRNRLTRTSTLDSNTTTTASPRRLHTHKLLYFIISCIFIAITFLIIFSLHCKKCCQSLIKFGRKQQTNIQTRSHRNYDRFTDTSTWTVNTVENNFDGTLRVNLDETEINQDSQESSSTSTKVMLKKLAKKFGRKKRQTFKEYNNESKKSVKQDDNLYEYDDDEDGQEETVIDSASILPTPGQIVEAKANSLIYRTP